MLPIMVGATTRGSQGRHPRCSSAGSTPRSSCHPGVPLNAARLRFFLTSEVTEDEIKLALRIVKEEIAKC